MFVHPDPRGLVQETLAVTFAKDQRSNSSIEHSGESTPSRWKIRRTSYFATSIFIIVFYHIMTCMNNILFMCARVIDFDPLLMTFRFFFRTVLGCDMFFVCFWNGLLIILFTIAGQNKIETIQLCSALIVILHLKVPMMCCSIRFTTCFFNISWVIRKIVLNSRTPHGNFEMKNNN
jgi:hypothetical protein